MVGCPQAPCQFWNTCAWQSMIIQGTCGRNARSTRGALRSAEPLHVIFEQPLHFAIDGEIPTIEVEEALPFRVAITDREGVRPTIKRIAWIDHMRPTVVAL